MSPDTLHGSTIVITGVTGQVARPWRPPSPATTT